MTTRERWFLAGLVAAFFGLAALAVWNQARYQDVREAVNRYVSLDERQEKATAENAALLRQARPEIRRSLTRGEFEVALKRLKSLEEEDAGADGSPDAAKAVPLEKLWPAGSPERKQLQSVLQDLVRKQAEGYDMAPAQQKLVEVAQAARAGKQSEAKAAFDQAAAMVRDALMRPGFKPKVTLAAAGAAAPGATITQAEVDAIEKAVQQFRMYRNAVPQLLAAPGVTEPQRRATAKLQALLDELIAAYEQKRDLRPLMKLGDVVGKAFKRAQETKDWAAAEAQIAAMSAAVKGLPPLPAIAAGAPAPPAPPAAPGAPPVAAPVLPPAGVASQPGAPSAEGILKMLDFIRALPEDRYQAEKPKLSLGIAQMLALAAKSGAADAANGRGEAVGKDLQLALGPQGAVLGLTVFGELLSTLGEKPGGISVQAEGQPEIPIRGPLTAEGDARSFRIENSEGAVSMLVKPGASDLTVKVVGRRGKAGGPAFLNLSIPVRLGGWYWQAGAERQPITMDRSYQLAAAEGKLPSLVVGSGAAEVTVEAVTASDLAYLPREGRLRIRLPLTNEAGTAEHTVRLSAARRP